VRDCHTSLTRQLSLQFLQNLCQLFLNPYTSTLPHSAPSVGLSLKHRHSFRTRYPRPALEGDWIEPTIPNKTNRRLQRYRLTAAGRGKAQALHHTGS